VKRCKEKYLKHSEEPCHCKAKNRDTPVMHKKRKDHQEAEAHYTMLTPYQQKVSILYYLRSNTTVHKKSLPWCHKKTSKHQDYEAPEEEKLTKHKTVKEKAANKRKAKALLNASLSSASRMSIEPQH
jgi:hypothetical protein